MMRTVVLVLCIFALSACGVAQRMIPGNSSKPKNIRVVMKYDESAETPYVEP